MAGFNQEQMRQLQASLQPQHASLSALSETVNHMHGVITKDIEAVSATISKMQEDIERRITLLEGRSSNTSPLRKTSRVDDGGAAMGTTHGLWALEHAYPLSSRRLIQARRI